MNRSDNFARIEDAGRVEIPSESGVVERRRWQAYRPEDTLGASALIAACSLESDRPDDTAASVCFAVGGSGLRAAAIPGARGASRWVTRPSRERTRGVDGAVYELAGAHLASARHSDKGTLTLAAIGSEADRRLAPP